MHLNNKTYLNPKLLTVRDVSGDTAASNKNFKDDWTFEDSETFHRKVRNAEPDGEHIQKIHDFLMAIVSSSLLFDPV